VCHVRPHAVPSTTRRTARGGRRDRRRPAGRRRHRALPGRRLGRRRHAVRLPDQPGRRRRLHGPEQRLGLDRPRVRQHRRRHRLQRDQLLDRQPDRQLSGRLPVHLQGLPLGRVHVRQRPAHPGVGDQGRHGDHQLEHFPARRRQRLRRGLRHLVQPDAHHQRPAQRHRADDLAEPPRSRAAVRLPGRHRRQPRRPQLQRLVRQADLGRGRVHADRRHHLGQQPGPAAPGGRRDRPRLPQPLVVPDRRGGRVRGLERRGRPGHQFLLPTRGRRRRAVAEPDPCAPPRSRPRPLRRCRNIVSAHNSCH
jgi:hypothetical protein